MYKRWGITQFPSHYTPECRFRQYSLLFHWQLPRAMVSPVLESPSTPIKKSKKKKTIQPNTNQRNWIISDDYIFFFFCFQLFSIELLLSSFMNQLWKNNNNYINFLEKYSAFSIKIHLNWLIIFFILSFFFYILYSNEIFFE